MGFVFTTSKLLFEIQVEMFKNITKINRAAWFSMPFVGQNFWFRANIDGFLEVFRHC
jgi:hypothetical protein